MAYRATYLSATATAAQRQRAPRDRIAVVGPKLKGGVMFGAALANVLAPLPGWDDAPDRAAIGEGGASLRKSRRGKPVAGGRRGTVSSFPSSKRGLDRKRGGSGKANRITRKANGRGPMPRSSSARGEVSAPVADFGNISDVTGVSSNAISSDHDSQTSSRAYNVGGSVYASSKTSSTSSVDDSSSISPTGRSSSSGSSPVSSSSTASTPPSSKLLPRWTSAGKAGGGGNIGDAGYLRHTASSVRRHTPSGAGGKGGVQNIHISRRGSIHIDRPLGLASSKSTPSKRSKTSRGSSSKKKKRPQKPKKTKKTKKSAATHRKTPTPSRSTRGAASPVDEIVDSIERKLKRERKRMMEGMERAKESNMNRQSALKHVSDAAAFADGGSSGSSSSRALRPTQYFWNAGSTIAPPPSAASGTANTSKAHQNRPATANRGIRSATRPATTFVKAKADNDLTSGTRQQKGSPHKIKIHRDGSVDIKFRDEVSPGQPAAAHKKSVAFADEAAGVPLQTIVEHALSVNEEGSSGPSRSSGSSSFHPTSALDEGLRQQRDMQRQSLTDFWAERKENLARVDTILYGDGSRRSRNSVVPRAPVDLDPGAIQNSTLAHVPLRSASPPPSQAAPLAPTPPTMQDQLRAYTDGLGLDNAMAKLEKTNVALNAQLLSQQRDMASIQEEMRGVTERALASSAELQDIKRREQERVHTAELRAAEDAAKRAEDAAEIDRRAARQLQIMEQNQRALSAQQAQKQRRQEGARRAIANKKKGGPIVRHAQARPVVANENHRPSGQAMMPMRGDVLDSVARADSLFHTVAEWMVWAQDCMVDQVCSSMGVAKEELLAFRTKSVVGGGGSARGGVPPLVPFPAHFTESLRACGDTSVIQPAARRLERTCAHIAAFMTMREKSRQQQFRTGMQNSRVAVTKAKRVTEAESKRKIAALNATHAEVLKDLKLKAAKAVEAAGRERTEAVEAARQRVTLAEQKADNAYRRGREEGDYELGRQKEKHAAEMAETHEKMVKLTNTLTRLRNRAAELENEARPEALASAMQRVTELEDALEEATEEARLGVDAQRQCEEDCADRVVRARAEHDRRLLVSIP